MERYQNMTWIISTAVYALIFSNRIPLFSIKQISCHLFINFNKFYLIILPNINQSLFFFFIAFIICTVAVTYGVCVLTFPSNSFKYHWVFGEYSVQVKLCLWHFYLLCSSPQSLVIVFIFHSAFLVSKSSIWEKDGDTYLQCLG